jgi:HAD superfamily hydrolase (TIGR01458 family)
VLTDDCKKDFAEFTQTENSPDYVVIGDLQIGRPQLAVGTVDTSAGWSYDLLNKIFNLLITGSKLIALHKGKFWQTDQGLTLDIGIFVAGLEYVTGQKATVIGKPSKTFFRMALKDLGVPASKAAMIGDDLDNDIAGAQAAGMKTILVKTGKYREELVKKSKVRADIVIDSLAVYTDSSV